LSNQKNSNHRNNKRSPNRRFSDKKDSKDVDETNPVIAIFKQCSKELDDKQDRYEKIVKFGRDITIESKRIIFLLHTTNCKNSNNEQILNEAITRLLALCETHFENIAKELRGLDQYQYARAFSSGLQEFVEAYTYYEYIKTGNILDWSDLQMKMTYEEEKAASADKENENQMETDQLALAKEEKKMFKCLVQPMEFMLGLADLSGEVMRRCITSLGSGDVETCFQACTFLQSLYKGYTSLSQVRQKDMNNKIYTLRQSVLKVENVCYNVTVRGGEAAKWGTVDNIDKPSDDVDEGFY